MANNADILIIRRIVLNIIIKGVCTIYDILTLEEHV